MGRTISTKTLLSKQYSTYGLSEQWVNTIGEVEQNFKMLVWGASGSGKTTFAMLLAKMLSKYGKVYYNSIEQGEGKSLQDVVRLTNMEEAEGVVMFGDKDTFDEMVSKIQKNRCKFCIIDSVQYANLTTTQYKYLIAKFPKKSFILISWEGSGGEPKGEHAKAIRYMVCIKAHVKRGQAEVASRFGPTHPFKIFTPIPKEVQQKALELV
jgi:energy-coupling factor transporter ATP-binding protein EcfA2